LPGRPKSTFFSSSFFLGAILLRSLEDEVMKLRETEGCREKGEGGQVNRGVALNRSAKADPAAKRWEQPAEEVKMNKTRIEIVAVGELRANYSPFPQWTVVYSIGVAKLVVPKDLAQFVPNSGAVGAYFESRTKRDPKSPKAPGGMTWRTLLEELGSLGILADLTLTLGIAIMRSDSEINRFVLSFCLYI